MAWVYRQYTREPAYFAAEDAARLGLWSRPDAVPPWDTGMAGSVARMRKPTDGHRQ